MARRAHGAARAREGGHPPQRRARAGAPGAAMGADRQGVRLRDRGRGVDAGGALRWPLAAARLSLHVRPVRRWLAGGGLPGLLLHGGQRRRRRYPPRAPRRDARQRVARAARGADRLQAPHGLEIPVGIVSGQRLQPGLRRVHRGGATKRHRVQLRRGAQGGNRPPPRGAARPECLRAGGRGRLPHVLVLRPGHRRAERHLAAARQAPEGRGDGFEGWPRRHDEYEDVEPIAINERS